MDVTATVDEGSEKINQYGAGTKITIRVSVGKNEKPNLMTYNLPAVVFHLESALFQVQNI